MTLIDGVKLTVKDFAILENKTVKEFTWETENGMTIQIISYGVTITSIKVPDKKGNISDIVLGYDNLQGYQTETNPYFGATIGRVANRTGNGSFELNGKVYELSKNRGNTHLHGGIKGFDKANWNYYVEGTKVVFSYLSVDGEEGYPANLLTNVSCEVKNDNSLLIDMTSKCTDLTPVNLTNHSYFNLAGHECGAKEIYKHIFEINADNFTPLNSELVTTGEIKSVNGTQYDFKKPKLLEDLIPKVTDGFDINFCLNLDQSKDLNFMARVYHPLSGRILEMYGNQPGVQFYTSNFLPEKEKVVIGKSNASYMKHGAFCLEPQNFPNAVNHKHFPNSILSPGSEYNHKILYKFSLSA